MASHFSDLGLHVENREAYDQFIDLVYSRTNELRLPLGTADLYWQVEHGFQYWFPRDDQGAHTGIDFHFVSNLSNDIQVMENLEPEAGGLSGMFSCQITIDDGAGMPIPEVPCNLNLPAAGLMGEWVPGAWYKAQIACFTETIKVYDSRSACLDAVHQKGGGFGPEHFVPSGTFSLPGKERDFEPAPRALIGGEVTSSRRLTNPLTGHDYDHMQISSLDMVYDVLCSPGEYDDLPQLGNIISGQFWLSALVWPERLPGYWESAQTWDDVLLALLKRMDAG